jgi:AdoMet-dependent rRNA methyltransferase SPB1
MHSIGADKRQGSKWKATRHDKFYKLAKEQGFRSRACFKLIHLNKIYDFLATARAVVDCGAAPGGWLQVCQKYMPVSSLVIGIDILPIKALKGVITLQEDITTPKCRTELKKSLQNWNVDVFLHDGAPNLGGATWAMDAFKQIELVVHCLKLATEFLRPGGWFVTKIFRSQDYNSLLWVLEKFFRKVDIVKPPASRSQSAEIFAVCQGFLAPKNYDRKLLDPEHLFKAPEAPSKRSDPFAKQNQKRNRGGYEDDVMILFKSMSVADFVTAEEPLDILGSYNELKFDEASALYRDHEATTEDIIHLCSDLRVLGKGDFRQIVNWLRKMKQYKKSIEEEATLANKMDEEEDEEQEEPEDPEAKQEKEDAFIDASIEQMQEDVYRAKVKTRRKRLEMKRKQATRLAMAGHAPYEIAAEQGSAEEALFNLAAMETKEVLATVEDSTIQVEQASESEMSDDSNEELDSDSDVNYDNNLDAIYEAYKQRRNIFVQKRREKLGLEAEELELDENGEPLVPTLLPSDAKHDGQDEDLEEEEREDAPNPLLVSLGLGDTKLSQKQLTNRFFARGLMASVDLDAPVATPATPVTQKKRQRHPQQVDADEDEDSDDEAGGDAALVKKRLKRKRKRQQRREKQREQKYGKAAAAPEKKLKVSSGAAIPAYTAGTASSEIATAAEIKLPRGAELLQVPANDPSENVFLTHDIVNNQGRSQQAAAASAARFDNPEGDFEEVPESDFDSFSDTDAEAETMAMSHLLLRKRSREKMINDSYSRYTWADPPDMPGWFRDNETMFNSRPLPITKAQVDEFKNKLKAINARPIKKIAEAKARKKANAVRRWSKMQQKAEVIANTDGGSQADKLRSIAKLYKKSDPKSKNPDKIYMVSKKGGGQVRGKGTKGRGKIVNVDKRLKTDMRGARRADRRKNGHGPGTRKAKNWKKRQH